MLRPVCLQLLNQPQFFNLAFGMGDVGTRDKSVIVVSPWDLILIESLVSHGTSSSTPQATLQERVFRGLSTVFGGQFADEMRTVLETKAWSVDTPDTFASTASDIRKVVTEFVGQNRYAHSWKEGRRVQVVARGPKSRRHKGYVGTITSVEDNDQYFVWLDAAQREVRLKGASLLDVL